MSLEKLKCPNEFDSLLELVIYFNDEKKCLKYLEQWRWGGTPRCPHCGMDKVYKFKDGKRFRCGSCREQFTVKIGTIFEKSRLPLQKWYVAMYLVGCHKKGISSHQLARDIKVTQKTGWFMLHRIRHAMNTNFFIEMAGIVQADETFVGGKNKNRHKDKKVKNSQGRSFKDKTPVLGLLEQKESYTIERPHKVIPDRTVKETIVTKESRIICRVVPDTTSDSIQPIIRNMVKEGSSLISDEWWAYNGMNKDYDHSIVDHKRGQYVNENGGTTNAVEGAWTQFKNTIRGTYHSVNRKHLQRYADEFSFRYTTKNDSNTQRFDLLLASTNDKRLTYKNLITNGKS